MDKQTTHFAQRRAALLAQMQAAGGGVAVIATAAEALRNNDADYPYRHDSAFYYLTGFAEPEAVLVLAAVGTATQSLLFCRERNPEREIWDGFRYGPDAAREAFGFDEGLPIGALDKAMPALLAHAPAVFYALASSATLDAQIRGWLLEVRKRGRTGVTAPSRAIDVIPMINEMRVFKDESEIALMQRAADISAEAHKQAMRATRPGSFEYEIEAELLQAFRRSGSPSPAYTSIVAAGANSCILHYVANNAQCRDGELVLIDAGCEYGSYASDITRTYPVNGRFSAPQRQLYELVLAAQAAALAEIKPGQRYIAGHEQAVRVLAAGMLEFGLLDKNKVGALDDVIEKKAYQQFYMHGTGHWLGLDVHDVGQYRDLGVAPEPDRERPYRLLAAGMVLTVEPGIYVRPADGVPEQYWNIGIRIEDDVLVTVDGHRILSHAAPKTVAEIEAWMAGA